MARRRHLIQTARRLTGLARRNVLTVARKPALNGSVITLKTADKRMGKTPRGGLYLSFTGKDAKRMRETATMLSMSPEKIVKNALSLEMQKRQLGVKLLRSWMAKRSERR